MGDHIIGGDRISSTNPLSVAVQSSASGALSEATFTDRVGEVQTTPTANTVLRRLKDLLTGIILAAGEAHIGAVGANASKVSVTPTLTVHATYAAGDYVGTSAVPMTFAAVARANGGTFVPSKVLVIDKGANTNAGELWLFDTAITPPADSAAWSVSDADAAHVIDVIPISAWFTSALNSVGVGGSTRLCKAATADSAIYGCYVIRGAPTADYADGDLTFVLVSAQD